jgi:NADP-reducing hydrogenase subunit HndC
MKIKNLEDLKQVKETGLAQIYPSARPKILVGMATCGLAAGAQKAFDLFESRALSTGWDGVVEKTGCIGFCYQEPMVDIILPGKPRLTYSKVDAEVAEKIWEELAAGKIPETNLLAWLDTDEMLLADGPRKLHEGAAEDFMQRTPSYSELDFFKIQRHVAMRNCGFIDPDNLEHYIARGGYFSLYEAMAAKKPEEVIEEVISSGLRGRGGAGFPTGVKWKHCRNASGSPKYVLCNADEGDPGAYMDRSLIEGDPHAILEGMLIGAYAMGASDGYIYVRAEYPLAVRTLERAISAAREAGLLGKDIFGLGFDFDIKINLGGGAFVCGEETALMASIEGKRGAPKPRPPFPAIKGLFDKPSNLNNVETWANVPVIVSKGAAWYKALGTPTSAGTKIFSLVGKVNRVGLVEVPMGVTLNDMVNTIGGGVPEGNQFKAIQTGGPSGGCIPKEQLDLSIDYDSLIQAGAIMGSGGMIVMDQGTCMVDMAKYFLDFLMDESCGKCVPCRLGVERMHEMLDDFSKGRGTIEELDELESLALAVKDGAFCALGGTAPNPVLSTIRHFRHEYEAHILKKRCPAKVCKELITYSINVEACNGCTLCAKECPAGAISGRKKLPHRIDSSLCVKCGACAEACKFGAVEVV